VVYDVFLSDFRAAAFIELFARELWAQAMDPEGGAANPAAQGGSAEGDGLLARKAAAGRARGAGVSMDSLLLPTLELAFDSPGMC